MLSKQEIADKIKTERTTDIMKVVPLSQPTIDRAKRADMSPMSQWALDKYLKEKFMADNGLGDEDMKGGNIDDVKFL